MKLDRIYWDSDCFLGWLKEEADKEALCNSVLEEAESGSILIVTSALTIAEVLNLKGQSPIQKDNKEKVVNLFRNQYIAVRGVTRHIAEVARDYVWDNGVAPKDAIHVATALDADLSLFNTFDEGLLKKSGTLGNRVKLIISKPQPAAQGKLF